jgi:hypothetical protein
MDSKKEFEKLFQIGDQDVIHTGDESPHKKQQGDGNQWNRIIPALRLYFFIHKHLFICIRIVLNFFAYSIVFGEVGQI